jgi:hypothetical protein
VRVGDVGHEREAATAARLDEREDVCGILLLAGAVHDRDVGALAGEGDRRRAADARVAARDEPRRPSRRPVPR